LVKERERLITTHDLKFNNGIIHVNDTSITLIQECQYKNLKTVNNKNMITINIKGIICQNLSIKD
jgi:hypothetical protein